ncbi:hypothetical protein AAFF_G00185120 [Aldrovandia affinis]|uniref:Uncharacterized protein n=1 Tax=Aldrovandia affinis TaxID=143900 RepID=A0AAD7W6U7_9TELE|nr:hypothetical protein AAFF_G00185120 [Aldrovandia affinis]
MREKARPNDGAVDFCASAVVMVTEKEGKKKKKPLLRLPRQLFRGAETGSAGDGLSVAEGGLVPAGDVRIKGLLAVNVARDSLLRIFNSG